MTGGAIISDCERYRYYLWRLWSNRPPVYFVMLNPSTADAHEDDPTIRRCIDFAKRWRFGSIRVLNLFALRSPDPTILKKAQSPVGPFNDKYLATAVGPVIVAWGTHGGFRNRDNEVLRIFSKTGVAILALGVTKHGFPAHPLYQPKDAELLFYCRKENSNGATG